jgi:hypothetical protein
VRIRLIRKLADAIDGVDLSEYVVGDVLDLPAGEARLLIAEKWAVSPETSAQRDVRQFSRPTQVAEAADSARRNFIDRLQRASEQNEPRERELPSGRRREDVLLDELHDARATTVRADS